MKPSLAKHLQCVTFEPYLIWQAGHNLAKGSGGQSFWS